MDKRRIVLLGATGFTGQRVLGELLARGELPTLVGRSRDRLLALAGGLEVDLPVEQVDVSSPTDLERVLGPNDVVVSTVGPFLKLGLETVTAAAHAGAHYLDSAATSVRASSPNATTGPCAPGVRPASGSAARVAPQAKRDPVIVYGSGPVSAVVASGRPASSRATAMIRERPSLSGSRAAPGRR